MSAEDLKARVAELRAEFEQTLDRAEDQIQAVRDRFLGRKAGAVTGLMKSLGGLSAEDRKSAGQLLNELKDDFERRLDAVKERFDSKARAVKLERERVDLTLPARLPALGRRHPLTVTRQELEDVFVALGYEVFDGPEVEDDYHCFEALNMPPDHPARDMQDTFYLEGRRDVLLRTHTSSAQIRYMLGNPHPPDVRIICPGRVYRRDEEDVTHSTVFHQVEALVVGEGITLGDLKGSVEAFLHALFGPKHPVRFRSSFFPYTEPSVEVDLGCIRCGGSGCRICKQTGWLEIMGSGIVDPAVFEAVNAKLGRVAYDPEKVTGFAFGLGIERLAMLRHGVEDIRLFYGSDLRFLEQFDR
jgi:phenylalanyl-tRNA synthetase alpha chain